MSGSNSSRSTTSSFIDKDKGHFKRIQELYKNGNIDWTRYENMDNQLRLVPHKRPEMPSIDTKELNEVLQSDSESDIESSHDNNTGQDERNVTPSNNYDKNEGRCSLEPFQHLIQQCAVCDDKNSSNVLVVNMHTENNKIDCRETSSSQENSFNSFEMRKEEDIYEETNKCDTSDIIDVSKEDNDDEISKFDASWRDLEFDLAECNSKPFSTNRYEEASNNLSNDIIENQSQNLSDNSITQDRKNLKFNYIYKTENVMEVKEDTRDVINNFLNDSEIRDKIITFINEHKEHKEKTDLFKKQFEEHLGKSYEKSKELNTYLTDIKTYLEEIKDMLSSDDNIISFHAVEKLNNVESLLNKLSSSNCGKQSNLEIKSNIENKGLLAEICAELKWLDETPPETKFTYLTVKPIKEQCINLTCVENDFNNESMLYQKTDKLYELSLPHFSVYPAESITSPVSCIVNQEEYTSEVNTVVENLENVSKNLKSESTGAQECSEYLSEAEPSCEDGHVYIPPLNLPPEEDNSCSNVETEHYHTDHSTQDGTTESSHLNYDVSNSIAITIKNPNYNTDLETTGTERQQEENLHHDRKMKRKKNKSSKSSNKSKNSYPSRYDWLNSESDLELRRKILDSAHTYKKAKDKLISEQITCSNTRPENYLTNFKQTKTPHTILQWLNPSSSEIDSFDFPQKIKKYNATKEKLMSCQPDQRLHTLFSNIFND